MLYPLSYGGHTRGQCGRGARRGASENRQPNKALMCQTSCVTRRTGRARVGHELERRVIPIVE